MNNYERTAYSELRRWQLKMERKPSLVNRLTKGLQTKVNSAIPEQVHKVITATIKQLVQAALLGSEFTSKVSIDPDLSLEEKEKKFQELLNIYKTTAAAEGAGTGAGGLMVGLADFPLLLGIKMKFLFSVAGAYGFDVKDFRERLYLLHIFQLAFSSRERQLEVYRKIRNWDKNVETLPSEPDLNAIDWRTFQQEYRDYIDVAKMLQLVPGIGAVVGAVANYRLLDTLGETAKYCYRLRILQSSK